MSPTGVGSGCADSATRYELRIHRLGRHFALASQLPSAVHDVGVDAMSHRHLRYRRSRHVALRQNLSLPIRAVPAPARSLLASHRV